MSWFHKNTRPHRRNKAHITRRIGRHDTLACEPLESRHLLTAAFDLIGLTALRNDPLYASIDGRLPDGQKIGVAVLDSGVEAEHADLRSNFVVYYDAVKAQGATTDIVATEDPDGHGTHVSGTAVGSNREYGVATSAGLIGVRVLQEASEFVSGDPLVRGLNWVATNWQRYNIRVVNMSLACSPTFETSNAVSYLESVGVTVVSASGNSYANNPGNILAFPAVISTLSVGSVWAESPSSAELREAVFRSPNDRYSAKEYSAAPDQVSAFSQRSGLNNQLFAPGSKILSADVRGGVREDYGTSMASPMVAGAVALLQDAAQTFAGRWLSPSEVRDILRNTADVIIDGNVPSNRRVDTWFNQTESELVETGLAFRRINVQRAVQFVRQTLSPTEDSDSRLTAAREIPALNGLQVFSTTGNIGRDGATVIGVNDVDLFKVTLASPGAITIRVDPVAGGTAFDPYLRVFDSAGTELAAANDSNTLYPLLASPLLSAGTYYVGVSSFNNRSYNPVNGSGRANGVSQGDYRLGVSLDNPDPNGVILGAVPFWDWGNSLKDQYSYGDGSIGSDPPPDGGTNRIPLGGNDVDMFEVVVPDTGFLNIRAWSYSLLGGRVNSSPFDTFLRVFNQAGAEIAWNDDDVGTLDSFLRIPVSRGERLFIGVSDARNNSYLASDPYRSFSAIGGGHYELTSLFENGDTNGSAFGALETLGIGATSIGSVGLDSGFLVGTDGGTDVDFYRFTARFNGVFDVVITSPDGSLAPSAKLWKWNPAKGECVLLADASYGNTVRHQTYVNAGETLFVSVTGVGNTGYQWYRVGDGQGGDTGSYAITSSLRPESDWWGLADDSASSPTVPSASLDQWIWGELGQDGSLYRGSTDIDLFRFVAPSSGKVEFYAAADFEESADTFLRVFNSSGQELAYNDDVNSKSRSSSVVLQVVAGQTYFVGVTGYGSGNLRAYTPNGVLNQVEGSTGAYFVLVAEVPTATFGPLESPGQNTVSTVSLSFSKPVFGVDINDFELTCDGIPVLLSGAMLSGSGSQYTISNLSNLTGQSGAYSLSLRAASANIADSNGTLLEDAASLTWIKLVTPAPIATIAAVSPTPRTNGVDTVVVTFSVPVTGVDLSDFVLTRDGVPVPLAGAIISGSGSQYSISNLTGMTAAPGSYTLTLQSANSGIVNSGIPLAGPTSQSWVVLPNAQPTVTIGGGIPSSRTTALSSVDITFSKAIKGFDLKDLSLSLNGKPVSLRAARLVGSGQFWSLTRVTTLTRNLGTYSLTINAGAGITDLVGNTLASVTPKTWENIPTIALSGVPAVSRRNVTAVTIRFNGNVSGVSLAGMSLSLDGQAIPLTGARVTGRGSSFKLSLPPKLASRLGTYTLEVGGPGSGITGGGLALQTRASISWRRV